MINERNRVCCCLALALLLIRYLLACSLNETRRMLCAMWCLVSYFIERVDECFFALPWVDVGLRHVSDDGFRFTRQPEYCFQYWHEWVRGRENRREKREREREVGREKKSNLNIYVNLNSSIGDEQHTPRIGLRRHRWKRKLIHMLCHAVDLHINAKNRTKQFFSECVRVSTTDTNTE